MSEIENLINKHVLLITGKGGVGRTTVTAFLARAAARKGKRVVVAELPQGDDTDEASSPLGGLFNVANPSTRLEPVSENIRFCLLSSKEGQLGFLTNVMRSQRLAKAAFESEPIQKLLEIAPTFRELGIFYHFLDLYRNTVKEGNADLLILDLPATGHAIGLTQLPHSVLRLIPTGKIAETLKEGQSILYRNSGSLEQHSGAVIVSLPEALPLRESLDLASELEKQKIAVLKLIINRYPNQTWSAEELTAVDSVIAEARDQGKKMRGSHEYQRMRQSIGVLNSFITTMNAASPGGATEFAPIFLHEQEGNSRQVVEGLLAQEGQS